MTRAHAVWWAAAALLVGCGAKSTHDAPSGGAAPEPSGCTLAKEHYADGESFSAPDGCNTCSCADGQVECTEVDCACDYEGASLAAGSMFTDASGRQCTCYPDRTVSCNVEPTISPITCEQVVVFYDELLREAKRCNGKVDENPCAFRVSRRLGCSCDTFVNGENWNWLLAEAYATHYAALGCANAVDCDNCVSPERGGCSVMDGCRDH